MELPPISWFDNPAKQSVDNVFAGLNEGIETLDLFRKYRKAQFEIVRPLVETIKILGMAAPEPLASIYTPPRLSQTISRRLFQDEWLKAEPGDVENLRAARRDLPTIDGERLVENTGRLLVLGGPGSGKTTFAKHLGLAYSDKSHFSSSRLKTSLLPIFVSLPAFSASTVPLLEFSAAPLVAKTSKYAAAFLERALQRGVAIVILDSLDEVPSVEKNRVIKAIHDFSHTFPRAKLLVTCRTADYSGGLDTFTEAELSRLTPSAIQKIVRAWFREDEERATTLIRLIKNDRGINNLTETPLLLSLICIQYQHDLALPRRKAELYRRCVETLLREWDTSRRFRRDSAFAALTDERKERLFEAVAGKFFGDKIRLAFPRAEVEAVVADHIERYSIPAEQAKGVIDEVERHHGIWELVAVDVLGFAHTSIHEYFVARRILAHRQELACIAEHFDDDNWSSVIEFIIAMHPDPQEALLLLVRKSAMKGLQNYPAMARRTKLLWRIYRCMCSGPELSGAMAKQIFAHIADSQLEIARIYSEGGVHPIAILDDGGVRHTYFYYRQRQTLAEALQPYRVLANEMIVAPLRGYADEAYRVAQEAERSQMEPLARAALCLCIVVPTAAADPMRLEGYLRAMQQRHKADPVLGKETLLDEFIEETRAVLKKKWLRKSSVESFGSSTK
jgi:hypothetical protein